MRHQKCEYYGGRCIYCGSERPEFDLYDDFDVVNEDDGSDYWAAAAPLGVYSTETGDAETIR